MCVQNTKGKEIPFAYILPCLLGFGGFLLLCFGFVFFWRDASILCHMPLFMSEIIDKFPGKRGSQ